MAKSLRSHRERRLRAFKRIRYRKKELERLKKMLGVNDDGSVEVNMDEAGEASIPDKNVLEFGFDKPKEKPSSTRQSRKRKAEAKLEEMEVEEEEAKTSQKELVKSAKRGYPAWMHQRQIRQIKFFLKKKNRKDKRRAKRAKK